MKASSNIALSIAASITLVLSASTVNARETTEALLQMYQAKGAGPFSAEAGEALWVKESNGRSCTSCHSSSVKTEGRHERTGKVIQAMSPSLNPQRLTNPKKINKWFLRNCKWTFARECTTQEKGDILLWLSQQ